MLEISNAGQLEKIVLKWGFLPFFKNEIEGFSVQELTPRYLWFSDEYDGPWEWKGPVICGGLCAYGKLFRRKVGYVSLDWLPDLINFRRSNYRMTKDEKQIYDVLLKHESLLSSELKKDCGYFHSGRDGGSHLRKVVNRESRVFVKKQSSREGFETAISNLQMGLYSVIADFEYKVDHNGRNYGWGIARYTTPEALYESKDLKLIPLRTPQESLERMVKQIRKELPQATDVQIVRFLK